VVFDRRIGNPSYLLCNSRVKCTQGKSPFDYNVQPLR
jgi:hypothetical protein